MIVLVQDKPATVFPLKTPSSPTSKATTIKLKPRKVESLGVVLKKQGQQSVGTEIEIFWQDDGWWVAEISNFNEKTGEHQLIYDKGGLDESFEWVDLSTLPTTELRQVGAKTDD